MGLSASFKVTGVMADREWFIQQQTGHQGPFSAEEIYRHFHEGRVRPESLIWKEGLGDWKPLKFCREITQAFDFNLKSEKLPQPLAPDVLDLLRSDIDKKREQIRQARPQLHQLDELSPSPMAPSKSKDTYPLSFEHDGLYGEWDQIARNFTPNPALEKLRPDVAEFEFQARQARETQEDLSSKVSNDLPPPDLCQKSSSNKDKEWEEFSGPLFSDVEKLNLWDEKKI